MKTIILILLTLSLRAQIPMEAKNVWAGALLSGSIAELTYQVTDRPGISCLVGFGVTAITGAALKSFAISYGAGIGAIIMIPVFTFKLGKNARTNNDNRNSAAKLADYLR